jgi:hypothetical protein
LAPADFWVHINWSGILQVGGKKMVNSVVMDEWKEVVDMIKI